MNKFLADELARACRYNKSHNCFTADLHAFMCNQHVDDAIKMALQGLNTYAKVRPDNGSHTVKCCRCGLVIGARPFLACHKRCKGCLCTCGSCEALVKSFIRYGCLCAIPCGLHSICRHCNANARRCCVSWSRLAGCRPLCMTSVPRKLVQLCSGASTKIAHTARSATLAVSQMRGEPRRSCTTSLSVSGSLQHGLIPTLPGAPCCQLCCTQVGMC